MNWKDLLKMRCCWKWKWNDFTT